MSRRKQQTKQPRELKPAMPTTKRAKAKRGAGQPAGRKDVRERSAGSPAESQPPKSRPPLAQGREAYRGPWPPPNAVRVAPIPPDVIPYLVS